MKKHILSYAWHSVLYAVLLAIVIESAYGTYAFLKYRHSPLGLVCLVLSVAISIGMLFVTRHRKKYDDLEVLYEDFSDIRDDNPNQIIICLALTLLILIIASLLSFSGSSKLNDKYPRTESYLRQEMNVSDTNLTLYKSLPVWVSEPLWCNTHYLSQLQVYEAQGTVLGLEQISLINNTVSKVNSTASLKTFCTVMCLLMAGLVLQYSRRVKTFNKIYNELDV